MSRTPDSTAPLTSRRAVLWAALLVTAGGALAATALSVTGTSAALRDTAALQTEVTGSFQLAALDRDGRIGKITQGDAPAVLTFAPAQGMVPGTTLALPLTLAGNAPGAGVDPALSVRLAGELTGGETSSLLPHLRISARETVGGRTRTLLGDPSAPERGVEVGDEPLGIPGLTPLPSRQGQAQAVGERWDGGQDAIGSVTVFIHLLDSSALQHISAQRLSVHFTLTGRSHA
ncbi:MULTISPECIES: hypothetical protein [Arthrobacter]|uniref:Uncharacterized protein n=2 Tax=Arthrobacter TaxID=1663 RepID=A0ABU9KNW9_9MICC|nr:hypothetical protein [Arthrobacter sp. YJM1]MDP5228625.1 hypothetical protein [Arthrobacter sp. YJM1]